jgi:GTP-binding protein EngB required for normal cell division
MTPFSPTASTDYTSSSDDTVANAIDAEFERMGIGEKLALIELIRDDLHAEGIECPGIVVIGSQSAGKSSVLESLTGIQFPRATNTCTRVPAIVQLQTSPGESYAQVRKERSARHIDSSSAVLQFI